LNSDYCPNHKGCQIINIEGFVSDPSKKALYTQTYCEAGELNWNRCKRFQTKKALNLCPAFVMPDSPYTQEEILDKMEEEL